MTRSGRIVFSGMDEVVYGQPVAEAALGQAERIGAQRAFILASGTLNRETDVVSGVIEALGPRAAGVFDRMPAHTPRGAVIEATRRAREAGADMLLTIGGGSATDAAKAVALCLANDVDSPEAMDALRTIVAPDGSAREPDIRPAAIPQVSAPTTLSAGEFSALSGVTDERVKTKELFRHPSLMPNAVILDPAASVRTPEWLWLSTGVRAVDHCVEGICSNESNPYGDAQAIKGLSLLASGLAASKADPGDLQARLDCQIGAWLSMGPLASGVPMGASHGIGYILGAAFDVPHGHTSCIMLPAVMRWNKSANAARQELVAAAMGAAGEDAGDALDRLIAEIGMPRSLSAVGIGPESFDMIAEGAMKTPWVPRNPRSISGPAAVREILEIAA